MAAYKNYWFQILMGQDDLNSNQKEEALKYTRQNFMDIIKGDEYLSLNKETFVELLKSDELVVDKEETVFKCIGKWMDYNNLNPDEVLHELLEGVRLALVSLRYLIKEALPFCFTRPKTLPYIDEAFTWKLLPSLAKETDRTKPRSNKLGKHLLAIGHNRDDEMRNSIEFYNAVIDRWYTLNDLNINARLVSAAVINDRLIIAGGVDENSIALNTVREVDLSTGRMKTLSPMNKKRSSFCLVTVGDGEDAFLFAIGGNTDDSLENSVERWNPASNEWTFVSPMNIGRNNFAAAVLEDKIYVVGNGDVEMYHVNEDKWEIKAPMNVDRSFCSAVFVGKRLYVMGGHTEPFSYETLLKTFDCYDTVTGTWETLANTSEGGHMGAGILNNSPVAIGGGWITKTVQVYDIDKDKWHNLASLNEERSGFTTAQLTWNMSNLKFY